MDQARAPGSKTALLQTISDLQHGGANAAHIGVALAERLHQEVPPLPDTLATLGGVESIYFRGVGPGGYDIYGVKFANGSAEFRIDVAPGGRIDDVNFNPSGDGTLGGGADCAPGPAPQPGARTPPSRFAPYHPRGPAR